MTAALIPNTIASKTWRTLEARIGRAAPELLARLPPGAAPADVDRAEEKLGAKLPPLVRALYEIHDGIGMPAIVDQVCQPSDFLCIADAVSTWGSLAELLALGHFADARVERTKGPVRPLWWNARWFPIAASGSGDHYCIDLDPAPGGETGQIIGFWHDDAERNIVAANLAEYLISHVDENEWAAREGLRHSDREQT